MASEWFYQVMGEQVGPVSGTELRKLAQHGTINRDTQVRKGSNGNWVPAERVNGLFNASDKAPPPIPAVDSATSPRTEHAPSGFNAATKAIVGVGAAVSIVGLGVLVWFLATRDTWESDHRGDVIGLSKDTTDLVEAKDPVNAVEKYDELMRLVGSRKLIAPIW